MIKSKLVFKEINSCINVQIKKINNLRSLENIRRIYAYRLYYRWTVASKLYYKLKNDKKNL